MGMYTEIMFPEHDVHFIAVQRWRGQHPGRQLSSLPSGNIINEWYAKDTSKKRIRAVMKVKGNAGESHLTTLAALWLHEVS